MAYACLTDSIVGFLLTLWGWAGISQLKAKA